MIFKKIINKLFKSNNNNDSFSKENNILNQYSNDENVTNPEFLNITDNKTSDNNIKNNKNILEKNEETFEKIQLDEYSVDAKISFKNIQSEEIKTNKKIKYNYDSKELFVEEVASEYYKNKYFKVLFTENNYWWFIYALLFWDIIFMKTDTCTDVPMNHPDFNKLYDFTVKVNGMPMDFFKETFYKSREAEIRNRLNELRDIDLNSEIQTSYNKHYGMNCRPIEDWNRYSLEELSLFANYSFNDQIVLILKRLIENFSENRRGLPDLTLLKNNEITFVEVKSKNDTLSPEQIKWHEYLVKNVNTSVIIFTVNKSDRQIKNLSKKYPSEMIEENIPTNIKTNDNPKKHYSFIPDGLIEVEYKEFSNSLKSVKAMDKYLDIVIDYEEKAQKLEKTNPKQAIAIYEKLVYEYKFGGNFPHDRLLVLYRKEERYEDMINVCDAAIANLGHSEYLVGKKLMIDNNVLSRSDKKIKRFEETKDKLELLLKNKPLEDKIKLARELEKENKIDEAIENYKSVIKENYPKKIAYNRLCILYRKKKNYEKELDVCNKAINVLNNKESEWFLDRKIKVQNKINK